jgi:hypothetical protein
MRRAAISTNCSTPPGRGRTKLETISTRGLAAGEPDLTSAIRWCCRRKETLSRTSTLGEAAAMLEPRGALETAPALPRSPEPEAQEDDVDDCEGKADLQHAPLVAYLWDRHDRLRG